MKKDKDIDTILRSVIEPYKMDPPANAWSGLNTALAQKQEIIYRKKIKRLKWIAYSLALLLVSSVAFYYLVPSQDSNISKNVADQKFSSNNKSFNSSAIKQMKSTPLGSASSQINNSLENAAPSDRNKQTKIKVDNSNRIPGNHENPVALNDSRQKRKRNDKVWMGYTKQNNNGTDENSDTDRKENISKLNPTESGTTTDKNSFIISDSGTPDLNEKNSLTSTPSGNSAKQIADWSKIEEPAFVLKDSAENKEANVSTEANAKNNTSRLSLSIFYSPDYSRNHLKDKTPDNTNEVAEYSRDEKSGFSYTSGLMVRYDLTPDWSVSTGGTFTKINYSMTLPAIYVKYNENNELHYLYPTSWGNIEIPNSGNIVLHDGDSLITKSNCLQTVEFINVPLMLRFQVTKSRFNFYSNTGFSVNFLIQEKAKMNIVNSESTIINNIYGLKKMNYGFLFSLGLQYNFSNGMGVFMEPAFKSSITSITHNTDVNCYPYSFGFNTGISIHLK
jgi:hypothetical protein